MAAECADMWPSDQRTRPPCAVAVVPGVKKFKIQNREFCRLQKRNFGEFWVGCLYPAYRSNDTIAGNGSYFNQGLANIPKIFLLYLSFDGGHTV